MDPVKGYMAWAMAAAAKNPNFSEAMFAPGRMGKDYNYNIAFLNGDNPGGNGHLSDIGKLPNHPTFSNESVYAIGRNDAGHWAPPIAADIQPDSYLSAMRQDQAPWSYHNPSRGLFYAPEEAAYQPPTPGMSAAARIWQAMNQPASASKRFEKK